MNFMPERRGSHSYYHGGSSSGSGDWSHVITMLIVGVVIVLLLMLAPAVARAYKRRQAATSPSGSFNPHYKISQPHGRTDYVAGYVPGVRNNFCPHQAPVVNPAWHPNSNVRRR